MLKTVLIGAGGIAWKHCEALRKLGVEISGIYDVNPVNAGRLAEVFGCPVVSDPVHAIAGADMVHILTPPSKRWEYVECALAYKKHIFMEKPVAISLEDAQRMELAAKAVPVQFMVGFTQRFRKGYRIIREWLDQGRLGDVVQAYCFRIGPGPGFGGKLNDSWRTAEGYVCGMTIESLSHDIDFLQSLAGRVIQAEGFVKGTVASLPQFDNNVNAALLFEGGGIGSITASWSSHIAFNAKGIIGTRGSVMLKGEDIWDSTCLTAKFEDGTSVCESLDDIFQEGEGYLEENRHFITCIEKNIPVGCDITVGREVLAISRKILDSSIRGR